MKIKTEIMSELQTKKLAEAFALLMKAPMIVLFEGDLGSGKTTFIKHLVKALRCDDVVTSPTFTLLNTYQGKFPIYHFDMYRLSSAEEALNVGFAEYFDKKTLDGIALVEWPENVEGLIKKADFVVEITKQGENHRTFIIREVK